MRRANDPLPSAPEPWAASEMPAFRSRPPYRMTEMIAVEPALAERLIRRLRSDDAVASLADSVRRAADAGQPVIVTGCGTSEHAAMAIAALLGNALASPPGREPRAVQALECLRRPPAGGVLVAVSHEGATQATNEALRAARESGARTALITVTGRSPAAEHADLVVETGELDQSWCHTVGYLSPLLAGVVLAAVVAGQRLDARAVRALLDVSDDHRAAAAVAAGLTGVDRILVAGVGPDLVTARELALKISEGARLPAAAHHAEALLHGHLAAATRWTGLILVRTDGDGEPEEIAPRVDRLLRAAKLLGMPAAGILGDGVARTIGTDDTSAGQIVLPRGGRVPQAVAAILGPVIPLQLLAERLARARGVNPDTLGREHEAQAAAHD
jgi:glutamine---fructose-6-phosphate transaminase (isomerizing)